MDSVHFLLMILMWCEVNCDLQLSQSFAPKICKFASSIIVLSFSPTSLLPFTFSAASLSIIEHICAIIKFKLGAVTLQNVYDCVLLLARIMIDGDHW